MKKNRLILILVSLLIIVGISIYWGRGCTQCSDIHTDFDDRYQTLNDSLVKNKESISIAIQDLLQHEKDSVIYYNYAVLLAKSYLLNDQVDSVQGLVAKITRFYTLSSPDNEVVKLGARLYNLKGNLYSRLGAIDSSLVCFKTAYGLMKQSGEKKVLPDLALNLADAYVRTGKFDKGGYWYGEALALMDTLKMDEDRYFPVYYGLAQVYMSMRNYERCDLFFEKAARWFDKMELFEKCIYLNNRGNSYYFRKDYQKALTFFQKEHNLAVQNPGLQFEEHLSEVNMGEIYLLMNQLDSAAYYLDKSQRYFKSQGNTTALYYIDTQLIGLAIRLGDLDLAKERIIKSATTGFVEPTMQHIRNNYLQAYYEASHDYKNAYKYHLANDIIDDSLRNDVVKMRIASLAYEYKRDSTLMKQDLLLESKENEVLKLNSEIYFWMFMCLSAYLIFILIWRFKEKRQYKEHLQSQRTIASLRMENLRNRVSPHFIFNVLNQEMINYTSSQERRMGLLVRLMRRNLELTDRLCVTLEDELDFVTNFVELKKPSLEPNFEFSIHIDDAVDCGKINILSMLIQIPVENALKHALKGKEGRRCLWIEVKEERQQRVLVMVKDNGGGFKSNSYYRGVGIGLKVMMQSIQLLNVSNKEEMRVTIKNEEQITGEMGCVCSVSIPIHFNYDLINTI